MRDTPRVDIFTLALIRCAATAPDDEACAATPDLRIRLHADAAFSAMLRFHSLGYRFTIRRMLMMTALTGMKRRAEADAGQILHCRLYISPCTAIIMPFSFFYTAASYGGHQRRRRRMPKELHYYTMMGKTGAGYR